MTPKRRRSNAPAGVPTVPTRPAAEEGLQEAVGNGAPQVPAHVRARLKRGAEQHLVVGPVVAFLQSIGYDDDQLRYGRNEWQVPKSPSEATKRDRGQRFAGFPVDIAVFESPERTGMPEAVLAIIEAKEPSQEKGVTQLASYMQCEPHARLGVWVNSGDPGASAVFLFRAPDGRLERHFQPLRFFPPRGQPLRPGQESLVWGNLTVPSQSTLVGVVERLLHMIVAGDSNVTRREDQLDQLCGILLLKLSEDQKLKMRATRAPRTPASFRPYATPAETAAAIRARYHDLVRELPATFTTAADQDLRFSPRTIHDVVEVLAPYRLIDVGTAAVSTAFQRLRTEALKQGEGQYFTPEPVVRACVQLLDLSLRDVVIDPAAGTGGFLVAALNEMSRLHHNEADIPRWAADHLIGIDKDAIGVKLTRAVMKIAGDGSAACVRGDSIRTHLWETEFPHLLGPQFADGRFTKVITNPPFGANLIVKADDLRLARLDIGRTVDPLTGEERWQDTEIGIVFLQRAYNLLQVGGTLGIVLPETYFFSPSYHHVQEWVAAHFRLTHIVNIPMEAFTPFCRAKTNFYIMLKREVDS